MKAEGLPTKLNLPVLPAQYSNLQASCIYAGVDEQKTPRQHLGEPIYQLIECQAEESRKKLAKLPWLWAITFLTLAACFVGILTDRPAFAWALSGSIGLGTFGYGLNLVRKRYEPAMDEMLALAENDGQKWFALKTEELRRRMALGPEKGGAHGTETVQSAWGGHTRFRNIHPSLYMCDHGHELLIKDSGFEAVRTWRRKPIGPIQLTFSTLTESSDVTSREVVGNTDRALALSQIAWLRNQVATHGMQANGFREMLDLMEGMIKYHDRSLDARAAQLREDGKRQASLSTLKRLSSGQPTPFSTYLKQIDLSRFPTTPPEPDGTGSEPPANH